MSLVDSIGFNAMDGHCGDLRRVDALNPLNPNFKIDRVLGEVFGSRFRAVTLM